MQTFYGDFRALENEFLCYLSKKQPGPKRPVLLLCPSGRLAEHLRRKLAEKNGLISNLFFVTFSQLVERLDKELPGAKDPLLPSDGLHEYILKKLLAEAGLNRYRISRGFITALQASLRDLADGLATPEVLAEHLCSTTDPILLADEAHLQWLVKIYRAYQEKMEQIPGFRSYQTYFSQAVSQIGRSSWLQSFDEIILYGFYELTGRQLELFNVLRSHYDLSIFWLYNYEPAFEYGRKFFETNVLGASNQNKLLPSVEKQLCAGGEALNCLFTDRTAKQLPGGLRFVSAPNPQKELSFTAKEILRLHEEEGIPYADMAITARSLEPYKVLLPNICEQHGVPLQADFVFPATAHPLGVFLTNLLSLARGGFDREDVLSIVDSPYFKYKKSWRYLIEICLAKRDFAQWQDLIRPTLPGYDPDFLSWLQRTKNQLEQLEESSSWQDLRTAALQFLQDNTDISLFNAQEADLWQQVEKVLQGFERYRAVNKQAGKNEFLDELLAGLQKIEQHQILQLTGGVRALDVLNLRGLHFKVLFVLGLNEKSFPQLIREDPVLKDHYRRILRDQLGFWINPKMERFDEERMLFFTTCAAAEEKLYCSLLRYDKEGKPLIPSSYMVELARAAGADIAKKDVIFLNTHLETQSEKGELLYLTEKEISRWLAIRKAGEEQYQAAGLLTPEKELALVAARQIGGIGSLTERDGLVQSGLEIFNTQNKRGFSPSALQDLARCPMKYFFSKGLGLKEKEDVLSRGELAPNLRGNIYHAVLMDYYKELYEQGLVGQLFDSALQVRLERTLATHCTPASYKEFGIYPVIWDLILTDIHDKLSVFVQKDAEHLEGYIPSLFETEFAGHYAPSPELQLMLHGVIDRIDINSEAKSFRIVDYKSSRYGGEDLAAYMFKKVILQPLIYLILAQQMPQLKGLTADGAALLNVNQGYGRQELSAAAFEQIKPQAADFFVLLTKLITDGQFFMQPGEHCVYCPYGAICRKDSFHSLLRVHHHSWADKLEGAKCK